ncbi:hypothetical protein BGX27_002461 [Mortierella sp. AM989]|nr:hypothetical protein BGX27_002461 [Mortierella sp. AM989]
MTPSPLRRQHLASEEEGDTVLELGKLRADDGADDDYASTSAIFMTLQQSYSAACTKNTNQCNAIAAWRSFGDARVSIFEDVV